MRENIKAALQRLQALAAAGLRVVPSIVALRDLTCAAGLGCIGYGLAQVYEPAAWCVVGAALFWLSTRQNGPVA